MFDIQPAVCPVFVDMLFTFQKDDLTFENQEQRPSVG